MEKQIVKIFDQNFSHSDFSSDLQESKYIIWDRNKQINDTEPIFITDNHLFQDYSNLPNKKIGWLMEPRSINPAPYEWIKHNYNKFDTVLTYDKELLSISDKFMFCPHGMCWIKPEEQKLYEKTKLLSIIASNKKQTIGHRFRHLAIETFKMDVYGRGYNPIDNKITALKDYAFSVVIENDKLDYYFTEKLLDCFVTYTIPVYYGCPSIGDFFNMDGILVFDDIKSLQTQINSVSLQKYESMLDAVKDNFERAQKFLLAEDWIFENTNCFK